MGVKVETDENGYRVYFDGELTIYTVAEYRQAILDSCEWDGNVVVDLSGVSEFDTGGLQLLAALYRQVMDSGNRLQCIDASEAAVEVFELSRFSDVLNCEHTWTQS